MPAAELHLTRHHPDAERWRWAVTKYGGLLTDWDPDYALTVLWHESWGNVLAHNLTYPEPPRQASGLFQHMPMYYTERIARALDELRDMGINEPWMRHDLIEYHLPVYGRFTSRQRKVGVFAARPNIAAAAILHRWSGWQPWTTTHDTVPGRALREADYGEQVWFSETHGRYIEIGEVGQP